MNTVRDLTNIPFHAEYERNLEYNWENVLKNQPADREWIGTNSYASSCFIKLGGSPIFYIQHYLNGIDEILINQDTNQHLKPYCKLNRFLQDLSYILFYISSTHKYINQACVFF